MSKLRSEESHIHRFVPRPAGRLYGKPLWRNPCVTCGRRQHPELEAGPDCLDCGLPTVVCLCAQCRREGATVADKPIKAIPAVSYRGRGA